jgi:hypothetical protein
VLGLPDTTGMNQLAVIVVVNPAVDQVVERPLQLLLVKEAPTKFGTMQ